MLIKIMSLGYPVIIQCQAGISRSNCFAAALLVYGTKMDWDDAIDLVKKKCPRANINLDLLSQFKEII